MMETDYSIEGLLNQINQYFYTGYAIAVWFFTSLIRWIFPGIDRIHHPKWVTLIVGLVLAIAGFSWISLNGEPFNFFKVITSFGLSIMGYDYLGKPLVDKVTGRNVFEAKSRR